MPGEWKDPRLRDDGTVDGYVFETHQLRLEGVITVIDGRIDLIIDGHGINYSVILERPQLQAMLDALDAANGTEAETADGAAPRAGGVRGNGPTEETP